MPKNSAQNTPLYFGKLLRFQRTFLEKSFASGLGAEAQPDNTQQKTRQCRVFYNLFFADLKHHLLIYLVFGGIDDKTVVVFPVYLHISVLAILAVVYGVRFCFYFEGK